MASRYLALLLCLWHTLTVSGLSPEHEKVIQNYLEQKRSEIRGSLPVVLEKASLIDEKAYADRSVLKKFSPFGEIIHWKTEITGELQDQDVEQYKSFVEGVKKLSSIAGLDLAEPQEWHSKEDDDQSHSPYTTVGGKVYQVGRRIGNGAFGIIREAWIDKQKFALKTEPFDSTKQNKGDTQLDNEYKCYMQIEHYYAGHPELNKCIHDHLPVIEIESKGIWSDEILSPKTAEYKAMIMERLGADVYRLFQLCGGLIKTRTILEVIEHIVKALQLIHKAGILHRDIKPQNLLFTSANSFKLVDFGVSCTYIRAQRKYLRPECGFVGSLAYAPKELLEPDLRNLNWAPRFDLHNLGYVLLELWHGSYNSFAHEEIDKHRLLKNKPMKDLCVGCPPEFVAFLEEAQLNGNPVPSEKIDNMLPDYDKILKQFDVLKRKFGNNQIEFDWIRKIKMLFQDPEVCSVSYKTWYTRGHDGSTSSGYTLSNYIYLRKFYSEIFYFIQEDRMQLQRVPLILDDALMENASALAKEPEANQQQYTPGTVAYRVSVRNFSLKEIFEKLESQSVIPNGSEPNVGDEGCSEKVKAAYKHVVNDSRYFYIGFGFARITENSDEYIFSVILSPELIGTDEHSVSFDSMRLAFNNVMDCANPETMENKAYHDKTSVTWLITTELADENTVTREILSEGFKRCHDALLLNFLPAEREPNTLGYAYRIDNINNCVIIAVTMFKKQFYSEILDKLQAKRKHAGLMMFTLNQPSKSDYHPEDRIWGEACESYGFVICKHGTLIQDFEKVTGQAEVPKRSGVETCERSCEKIGPDITPQSQFNETVLRAANVYVRFEHYRELQEYPTELRIKFTSVPVSLEGGMEAESDEFLMKEAQACITDVPSNVAGTLPDIVVKENSITAFAIAKLTSEGVLTMPELQNAIQFCLTAIAKSDLSAQTNPGRIGYCYNLEKTLVSVSVAGKAYLIKIMEWSKTFGEQVSQDLKILRGTKEKMPDLTTDLFLTQRAQAQSKTGKNAGGLLVDPERTKTFMVMFVATDRIPDIVKIFRKNYITNLPEKVRPADAKVSTVSRKVLRYLPKSVQRYVPWLGDSFKNTVQDPEYCRYGFGSFYEEGSNSYRMVFKFALQNQ